MRPLLSFARVTDVRLQCAQPAQFLNLQQSSEPMKRDMDLVRDMLLRIEEIPAHQLYELDIDEFPQYDPVDVGGHFYLLAEGGFVEGYSATRGSAHCRGLTWQGHDFLDAVRSNTVWQRTKKVLKERSMTVSFDVLKDLATSVARSLLET